MTQTSPSLQGLVDAYAAKSSMDLISLAVQRPPPGMGPRQHVRHLHAVVLALARKLRGVTLHPDVDAVLDGLLPWSPSVVAVRCDAGWLWAASDDEQGKDLARALGTQRALTWLHNLFTQLAWLVESVLVDEGCDDRWESLASAVFVILEVAAPIARRVHPAIRIRKGTHGAGALVTAGLQLVYTACHKGLVKDLSALHAWGYHLLLDRVLTDITAHVLPFVLASKRVPLGTAKWALATVTMCDHLPVALPELFADHVYALLREGCC